MSDLKSELIERVRVYLLEKLFNEDILTGDEYVLTRDILDSLNLEQLWKLYKLTESGRKFKLLAGGVNYTGIALGRDHVGWCMYGGLELDGEINT